MPFWILKFLHTGSMFMATALAVGPAVTLYLVVRNGDVGAIRRALAATIRIFRASGAFYGLGILFGVLAALAGAMDLTAVWLLIVYLLVGVLLATNFVFERWVRRVERSIAGEIDRSVPDLALVMHERSALYSLAAMIGLTLTIVLVMVIKAELLP